MAITKGDVLEFITLLRDQLDTVRDELGDLLDSEDPTEHLIARLEQGFDAHVAPIDLPGPDSLIDPILRVVIRPFVIAAVSRLEAKKNTG